MDIGSICISFIVAIFGIAYPILFQVVSRLDEKYSSLLILNLFNKEKERNVFIVLLISSLLFTLLFALKIPPIKYYENVYLIKHSSIILLTISTILLIISFFYFVKKILIYYTPSRFLKYLIKKHFTNEDEEYTYFRAISDILYFSIKEQNEKVAKTISDFLYDTFQKHREKSNELKIEYPACYYEVIHKSIEELANLKSKKLAFLEYRTIGGIWLLGEFGNYGISDLTYSWLWRNLLLAIKYERDDFVMYYWQNAHRYCTYELKEIFPKYSKDYKKIINQEEIDKHKIEKKRFLEFNYALGGILLYKNRYSCLNRIFNYTTSIPPDYILLPKTMGEIFEMFIQFRDPYERKYTWISSIYPFPDIEGLNADYLIKKYIIEYLGLLFIRQYSIQPYLITMKPLQLPSIPKTQNEKKVWIDNIDFFKSVIGRILSNNKLLKQTHLDFVNDEWLAENKKPKPKELINLYKKQIQEDYERTKIEQEISKEKKEKFYNSSKNIIRDTINLYLPIKNADLIKNNYNKWFLVGDKTIMDKSAFVNDNDSEHLNFDSFLASHISEKFKKGLSETFFFSKSKSYLIKESEIFSAIDKLNLNNDYIIIGFGNNIDWFIKHHKINNLTQNSYNDIDLINYDVSNYHIVGQSFFTLKKSDLPNVICKDVNNEEIKKYHLDKIDDEIKLYGQIIDLYKDNDIKEELKPYHPDKDLEKSVLIYLALSTEIRWKKDINNVMIKVLSEYRERGVPDKLSDIKKIE